MNLNTYFLHHMFLTGEGSYLISNKFSYDHRTEIRNKEGCYILIEGAPVTFINAYVPPGSKFKFVSF